MKNLEIFNFKPIAIARTCYPDRFGTPRQPLLVNAAHGFIEFKKEFQPEVSLEGLPEFSHLWLVFIFHKNTNLGFKAKIHPPRLGGQAKGIFATRSPHRPNPIGLSVVKIEKVEPNGVWVSGIDLVDGTPILDIKPYLPSIESVPHALGGWTDQTSVQAQASEKRVTWLDSAKSDWDEALKDRYVSASFDDSFELRSLVEETVKLDPRPVVYRGFEGKQSPYRETHAVRINSQGSCGDFHFRFLSNGEIEIFRVLFTPINS